MAALLNDVCAVARTTKNEEELIAIIRDIVPGTLEAGCILWYLERNPVFNATLRLEVACKIPERYRSFEIVDDIIDCASNTSLMKRLYEADVNRYGAFVAVQITEPDEIERMYESGIYEIQCAAASNFHANPEFLKRVIEENNNEYIKDLAREVLAVLTVKQTEDASLIEEMYKNSGYDVQLAAVSNPHARHEFLEEVIFDEEQSNIIRERALETFEKISST